MLDAIRQRPDRTPATFFRYDSYGATKAFQKNGTPVAAGAELTDLLYTGQRWNAHSRLYYYQARFYDPRIAQFVSSDPAREYPNPYAYVKWNPVRFTDPSGMTTSERLFDGGTVNTFGWMDTATGEVVPPSQVAEAAAQQAQETQVATAAILPLLAEWYGLPLVALTGKVLGDVATDLYKHRSEGVADDAQDVDGENSSATSPADRRGDKGPTIPKDKVVGVEKSADGLAPTSRPMSPEQARRLVDRGRDVFAGSRGAAEETAGRGAVGPERYDHPSEPRFPHFHRPGRQGGHIFFPGK